MGFDRNIDKNKLGIQVSSIVLLVFAVFVPRIVFAATGEVLWWDFSNVNLATMLDNFSKTFPAIWTFLTAASFLMGISTVTLAVYKLKIYGQMRTMMSSHTDIRGTIMLFFVGGMLMYWPETVNAGLETLFADNSILAYENNWSSWSSDANLATKAVIDFIRIVGFVAFLRGLLLLKKLGAQQAQQGSMAKALVHLAAGILALNIVLTAKIFADTFGITWIGPT